MAILITKLKVCMSFLKKSLTDTKLLSKIFVIFITLFSSQYAYSDSITKSIIGAKNASAIKTIKIGGDFQEGLYEEEVVDLEVKVIGGDIKHKRYLKGGITQFNPNWAQINQIANPITGELKTILRNNYTYFNPTATIVGGGKYEYVLDKAKSILQTEDGFTWSNYRTGDWIKYGIGGGILSYGNKQNTIAHFDRDLEGAILGISDTNQDLVISYDYYPNGYLKSASDYTMRQVNYFYNNNWISGQANPLQPGDQFMSARGVVLGGGVEKVVDVLGNEWGYEYGPIALLSKRTAPNGQVFNIQYQDSSIPDGGTQLPDTGSLSPKADNSAGSLVASFMSFLISPAEAAGGAEASFPFEYVWWGPEARNYNQISSIRLEEDKTTLWFEYSNENSSAQWTRKIDVSLGGVIEETINQQGDLVKVTQNERSIYAASIGGVNHAVSDENRNVTSTKKDRFENVLSVTNPDGTKTTYTYLYTGDYSLLESSTDENGVVTNYEYDADSNLVKMTEAIGTSEEIITSYIYDSHNQGTQINYADGRVESWTYDDKGNVVTFIDGEGILTRYENYDALGNPGKVTDGRGNVTQYSYNAAGNLTQVSTPLGHITKYEYDAVSNLTKLTDANNNSISLAYDTRNRVKSIRDALNYAIQFKYNTRGQITQILDRSLKVNKLFYDLNGKLIRTSDGNNNSIQRDLGYLNLKPYKGLLNKIIFPTYSTEFEYDKRNRPISEIDKTVGEADRERKYRYDAVGNLIQFTDPSGNIAKSIFDAHNRLVKYEDRAQQDTQFSYDVHHNLNKVTNAKNNDIRRFEFNNRDEVTKEILPDNAEYQTVYDANGNVTQQIDVKGQVSVHEYDLDNRLTSSRTFTDISQITDNANAQKTTSYVYDAGNRLTGYNDGITQGTYSYDANDRLLSYTINYGSFSKTSSYTYHPNGKKKSYTGPDGQTIGYGYDNNNQLQTVSIPGQGTITVNENNWLVPKAVTYPGGIKQNNVYDGYLRAKNMQTIKTDNNVTFDHQYKYDAYDNLTSRNVRAGSVTGENAYTYDNLDRLTQYTTPNSGTIALGYDELGNRITDSRDADSTTWQYDNRDRLTQRGKLNYSYDINGSLTSITHADNGLQRTFVYNFDNRLIEVKGGQGQNISTYQYDPFGRRISKTVNNLTTYYFNSGDGLIAELSASGQISSQYGYRPDGLWGTNPLFIKQGGYTGYYQNDHLGTPQQIVSSSGQILWNASYSAFGLAVITTDTIKNNLRLAGQYFDQETDLHYNYFRYYDPNIGRYVTSDPIGLGGGINTYGYVGANPLYYIDPTGELACGGACIAAGLFALYNAFDIGSSAIDTVGTVSDPCSNGGDKLAAIGIFALGIIDVTPGNLVKKFGGDELVDIYRAVGPDELADIQNTKQLINRGSAEGKYFTSSAENASDYAKQAVDGFGDPAYTIIKTKVPKSSLPSPISVDRGIPAYVIPNKSLPNLTPEILNSMPIPSK